MQLIAVNGDAVELDLLADTGNPFAAIVGRSTLEAFIRADAELVKTNFGGLKGGWLQLRIPELNFDSFVLAYGSDDVEHAARASSSDLSGLAGLPLLRLFEYGGDADAFWLRPVKN